MPPKKLNKQSSTPNKPSTSSRKPKRKAEEPSHNEKTKQKKSTSASSESKAGTSTQTTSKTKSKKSGWNLKLSSWNVNGLRACVEKKGLEFLDSEKPDILCLQETKCSKDKLPLKVKNLTGYNCYWTSSDKAGYAGVGILSKVKPIKVQYGIGNSKYDDEGRVIMAEYDDFFLVTAYVPNSGRGLVRLDFRLEWDEEFRKFLNALKKKKHVILCGDLNVAHEEIDIANPKTNTKNAGFTIEERESFSTLLNTGYIDSFRYIYPEVKGAYTFWTYMKNARTNNVGWRLDYFVLSENLLPHLKDSIIHDSVMGSDHCPISLLMSL